MLIDSSAETGYRRSLEAPCEMCGSRRHPTTECCSDCYNDRHTCPFCGETLGHSMLGKCGIVRMLTIPNGVINRINQD